MLFIYYYFRNDFSTPEKTYSNSCILCFLFQATPEFHLLTSLFGTFCIVFFSFFLCLTIVSLLSPYMTPTFCSVPKDKRRRTVFQESYQNQYP